MVAFWCCWFTLVLQRLAEIRTARRNTRALLARGGREASPGHYRWMVLLHTAWFAVWALEAQRFGVQFHPEWLALALAGQLLRAWARASLGARWTTRILVVPGERPVLTGPYRFLTHPNYVGVVLELFAFPKLFECGRTAWVFSLANLALLGWRIRCEENAWAEATQSGA